MLDNFINDQPIVYRLLKNSKKKDKISHAYLFETNGYSKTLDIVISFAKYLVCKNDYSSDNNCGDCSICSRIDNNNYLELKIINPDGLWIKKEQLEELQHEFNKKALENSKKIYIINHAEKLNTNAANSILKFLEEPEDNIIAILVTDNIYQLLDTIVSRCQIISLNKNKEDISMVTSVQKIANSLFNEKNKIESYINSDNSVEKINKIVDFIIFYEKNKINTILHISKLWYEHFQTKEEIMIAFDIIILYYKDVINFKLEREVQTFNDYIEKIQEVSNLNEVKVIAQKISVILDLKDKIMLNVNNNLLMDKFILSLEEV
jgi:DNA polymerase-3 subunit delta'